MYPRLKSFCQSDEILPNLVTLITRSHKHSLLHSLTSIPLLTHLHPSLSLSLRPCRHVVNFFLKKYFDMENLFKLDHFGNIFCLFLAMKIRRPGLKNIA